MRIPRSLRIGGHVFRVVCEDSPLLSADLGQVRVDDNSIYLNTNQARSQQESTLIHEIIEALIMMNKLDVPHSAICILETGLYQVLKDNNLLRP